jgi:type II secretory ATPase GspE/PulE/Tfp pilus assembly ATPase PilB-like protein
MLGEIRDRFSSNAAQQLAETGHLGLGTVHAHLLSGIVPRLVNDEIGMSREILTAPNMTTLLAYQALVPKLCPSCAMETAEAVTRYEDIAAIASQIGALSLDVEPMRWKRVGGCSNCNERGTVGLTVAAEMFMPDEDWLSAIREGRDTEAVQIYRSSANGDLNSPDMTGKTVFEHTLYKSLQGQVDARQCSRFEAWHRYMSRRSSRHVGQRGSRRASRAAKTEPQE